MERKIGEIFEKNGEWYQCLKSPDGSCKHCDMNFGGKCPIPIKECVASSRSDLSYVIFKKLEKIGEPYISSRNKKRYQMCRCFCLPIITKDRRIEIDDANFVGVEIKQNKEDMEENKDVKQTPLEKLVIDFFNNRVSDIEFEKLVSELYAKHSNSESIGKNLKPFDLEAAKLGKPVCTRDGRKARIVCFEAKGIQPIAALVTCGTEEKSVRYKISGRFWLDGIPDEADLMMLPEKKEGWVNVYKRENEYICENECSVSTGIAVYKSEGEAKRNIDKNRIYVNTIKINWEE